MIYESYAHRFADIILNSEYALKKEIEQTIQSIDFKEVEKRFDKENTKRKSQDKKPAKGKQATINLMFRELLESKGWEAEKNVFEDPKTPIRQMGAFLITLAGIGAMFIIKFLY